MGTRPPPPDLRLPDIEGVDAALLLVILEVAQEIVPEMTLDPEFESVKAEVLLSRRFPPRLSPVSSSRRSLTVS